MTHTCIKLIYKITIFIHNNVDFARYMHMLPCWFYQVYSSCFLCTLISHLKFSKRLWYYFSLLAYIVVLDLTLICKKWNDFLCNIWAEKSQARENAEICLKIIWLGTPDTWLKMRRTSRYIQVKWQVMEAGQCSKYQIYLKI